MAINHTVLTGRLTSDPELRTLRGGDPICKLRLAVQDMAGRGKTGYVDVSVFGKSGQACADHLTKGWLVAAHGRLQYREWDSDHGKRSAIELVGHVEFLTAPRGRQEDQDRSSEPVAAGAPREDDDIPF